MEPRVWVKSITFSDGTSILFERNDVVIIVGPNNCGKSESLRGIIAKVDHPIRSNVVVTSVVTDKEGSADELIQWLASKTRKVDQPFGNHQFAGLGATIDINSARLYWGNPGLGGLTRFFCHLLSAEERLVGASPAGNIALATQAPSHPIHFLQRDDRLEEKLSKQFRRAFGLDLVVHRNAGNVVPLHVGEKPTLKAGQDRVSLEYVTELEKLPPILNQGDGMRSFAGVLLYAALGSETVLLIDEPEAFLHPPQARLLGQTLVLDRQSNRQLFVATHSGDVLRGILDSNSPNVRVIRLRRSGEVNVTRELNATEVTEVWSDPLLRYSNILDGLFHEKVVVCESDADCRFYAAIMDALFEAKNDGRRKPDIMFTHCGGKARLALVIRALRKLEVPTAVVTDFDVLSEEHPLRDIVQAAGGDWDGVSKTWEQVKNAVNAKKPELSADGVKKEVTAILEKSEGSAFPSVAAREIQAILRRSSPWATAKSVGAAYVPNGGPSQACERLLSTLRTWGIFVVPGGELESFCKTAGGHGPAWVNAVIGKNLKNDPEFDVARKFVSIVIG